MHRSLYIYKKHSYLFVIRWQGSYIFTLMFKFLMSFLQHFGYFECLCADCKYRPYEINIFVIWDNFYSQINMMAKGAIHYFICHFTGWRFLNKRKTFSTVLSWVFFSLTLYSLYDIFYNKHGFNIITRITLDSRALFLFTEGAAIWGFTGI